MKMTSFLLLIGCLHVSGEALPQNITLVMNKAPLRKVFKEIRKQSGHLFLYDDKLINAGQKADVWLTNVPLKQALEQIFENTDLEFEIVEKNIVLRRQPVPALRYFPAADTSIIPEVTGKVTDEKGEPLIGTTVIVRGSKQGGVADVNGVFRLRNVHKDAVMEFRFTGYTTREVKLDGRSALTVAMEIDNSKLEEVVVVGYGTQKKANLTGAVDQVSGQVLEDRPITRVSQALQGMVGNLNITTNTGGGAPNATQNINVRGFTGLGTSGGPLIVIDGVPGGDINAINPNDIEGISVIKDAASAAIYGSSAPYGVLLITTKQGKKGAAPKISYNNNLNWATPINLPQMLNSREFAEIYNEAAVNAGAAKLFDDATLKRINDYQSGSFKDETVAGTNNNWQSWTSGNANNDWFKIYFKDAAFSQQHNVGVTGGGNKSTYYAGLGFNDRGGMYNFGDDRFKRYNMRGNLSSELTSWMTFNLRSAFTREAFNSPNTYAGRTGGNYMHQIARKWPTVPLFNPDGHYSETSDVLLHLNGGRLNRVKDGTFLTGEFQFNLAKGLNLTTNYTFDGYRQQETNHNKTVLQFLPDGTTASIGGTTPNGFSRSDINNEHHVINAYASYERSIKKHSFKVMGGYIRELTSYTTFGASNNQLYTDDIPALNLTYGVSPTVSDFIRKLAVEGFFGRLNYSYDDKYLLELNGRYDGTSRFLDDVRWKVYPGVSAGWNVHRESFWQPLSKVVNTFKLRGSYGSLGDQSFLDASAITYYPFYPELGVSRPTSTNWLFGGAQQAMVTQPGLVNNNLTWVTTSTLNLGLDATFFDNRLTTSFDWYVRRANNFAGPSQVLPAILGTGVPPANNTDIETRGWELMLNWTDRIGEVGYRVRGVLSDYRGKVLRYPNDNMLITNWYSGEVMGNIWGYTTAGYFKTDDEESKSADQSKISNTNWTAGDIRYEDINGDGVIDWGNNTLGNSGDRRVIGNNTPRYSYSLIGEANWKGFDVYVFLQGIGKRDAWVGSNYFWGITGDQWQSSPFSVHKDRWSPTNPEGYYPKFYMTSQNNKNTQTQTKYLQDASYLRIKNVQLGYTLPQNLISRINAQKIRMYVSIENLATFTNLVKTMDPELSISDAKIYPLQRTYSFGLNISF